MSVPALSKFFQLQGKTAVVTGGAFGIGRAVAHRLAECHANVAVVDINKDGLKTICEELRNTHKLSAGQFMHVEATVGPEEEANRVVSEVTKRFGRVDILVNNAGIFPSKPFLDITEREFDSVISTNLKGLYFFTLAAAKQMKQTGGGAIVNIGSIDGLHPTGFLTHYDASKGAVHMLTKSMALELAPHNIRVNCVAPGGTATTGVEKLMEMGATKMLEPVLQRIPMKRMATPDEIARMVAVFCTDLSAYATGSTVVVDGGLLLT